MRATDGKQKRRETPESRRTELQELKARALRKRAIDSDRLINEAHRAFLVKRARDNGEVASGENDDFTSIAEVRRQFSIFTADVARLAAAIANPEAEGAAEVLAQADASWNTCSNSLRPELEYLFLFIENIGAGLKLRREHPTKP